MSRREESKELKREKIIAAARDIIANQGLDKLTMRYLADQAQVSSRTPYNLFESKTDILVAIIIDAIQPLQLLPEKNDKQMLLVQLLELPRLLEKFCAQEHDFYRDIIWGIMSSGIKSSRDSATGAIANVISPIVASIVEHKECSDALKTEVLSAHIITQLLAIIGMWGGSQMGLKEAVAHIQLAWVNTLQPYATRKSKKWLNEAQVNYAGALEKELRR
jgi:AcrR family transcriptional regulator